MNAVLWGPLLMFLAGFGRMEYVWVIFNNLQTLICITQFDLKLPLNMITVMDYFTDLAYTTVLPLPEIYEWLRY